MSLAKARCPQCKTTVEVDSTASTIPCPCCETVFVVSKAICDYNTVQRENEAFRRQAPGNSNSIQQNETVCGDNRQWRSQGGDFIPSGEPAIQADSASDRQEQAKKSSPRKKPIWPWLLSVLPVFIVIVLLGEIVSEDAISILGCLLGAYIIFVIVEVIRNAKG